MYWLIEKIRSLELKINSRELDLIKKYGGKDKIPYDDELFKNNILLKKFRKFQKHSIYNKHKSVKPNIYYYSLSLSFYVNDELNLTIYYSNKADFNKERSEFLQRFNTFTELNNNILGKTHNYYTKDKYIERVVEKELIYTGSIASTPHKLVAYVSKI